MRKIILSTILAVGFAATTTMAGENTGYLLQLASKQEMLSQNIMTAYKKGDRGTSALEVVDALKSGHLKLKSAIHNPEIDNLLVYLNYRLDDRSYIPRHFSQAAPSHKLPLYPVPLIYQTVCALSGRCQRISSLPSPLTSPIAIAEYPLTPTATVET